MFGGGFPFGGGFEQARPKSDSTKYYKLLEVEKDASENELKKQYKKLSLKHHPDKGGETEYFKQITQAYNVLKNPEQRELYDKYGEDAIKEGMGAGGGAGGAGFEDLFGGMFGGMGGQSRSAKRKKGEDVVHKLVMTLEELYKGVTRTINISRQSMCSGCKGTGNKSGKTYTCQVCNGKGMQTKIQQIGAGMYQQSTQACTTCRGTGETTPPNDKCNQCNGRRSTPEKKQFEVYIEPGMSTASKIYYKNEAGFQEKGIEPGDIIFIIEQKSHLTYQRQGADLITSKKLSLKESLCGGKVQLKHLDGRIIEIEFKKGEVIRPEAWKMLSDCGMPVKGRPTMYGNLYINFEVQFPELLDTNIVSQLQAILPGANTHVSSKKSGRQVLHNGFLNSKRHTSIQDIDMDDDLEQIQGSKLIEVEDISKELTKRKEWQRRMEASNAGDESDEEQYQGAQRVQCQNQ